MCLTNWFKQLGPCSINHPIECIHEIIKFIDEIKQDNAIVVLVNLNRENMNYYYYYYFFFFQNSRRF